MSRQLPSLDLHAHIDPKARPGDLERLGAVVFAATRSLDEFESVLRRRDQVTVWGLGCHPGIPNAQSAYDPARFAELLASTAYVSEVGVDRRSKVALGAQTEVLASILDCLQTTPRIASIHSSGAPDTVLDALDGRSGRGAVLHWWRGSETQTRRAVELGCWFSVNPAGTKYAADIARIPLDRILTETDHPSGDRHSSLPRQPGAVGEVESALAAIYGIARAAVRQQVWSNLVRLVDEVNVDELLPMPVRRMLAAVRGGAA